MRTLPLALALALPAPILAGDAYEENDTCAQARELEAGVHAGLSVSKRDEDWYLLRLPPAATLRVRASFSHDQADLQLELFAGCDGALLDDSRGGLDSEEVVFINDAALPALLALRVFVEPTSSGDQTDYQLEIEGASASLGGSYCEATPNSTGAPALLAAFGSNSVAANDLLLVAEPVPAGQPGLFYYGPERIELPFGNGKRCVGPGGLGTFLLLPPVHVRGDLRLEQRLDLDAPPAEAGRILPGSTWHFQAWYRDPAAGGAHFDLSDGLSITFLR